MTDTVEKLKPAILALSEPERWELIAALFESLPKPPGVLSEDDPDFDSMLKRRLDELDSGKVKGVPAEQVMQRIREKYKYSLCPSSREMSAPSPTFIVELDRRRAEFESGSDQGVPADEFFRRSRKEKPR